MRVFVCSPLRGKDGQPSDTNIRLARRLMRAVFDAGHQPFVPHLLYPQVLSESEVDLKLAFAANYAYLSVCEEIWVYADGLASCSRGMRAEVEWVQNENDRRGYPYDDDIIGVQFMPAPFIAVKQQLEVEAKEVQDALIASCIKCAQFRVLNRQGICAVCFADGTPVLVPSSVDYVKRT